ncbi:MAG TPA: ImmA/IrrE family metallo-endopeptidase [Ktedonobacteraceae bacterium]|jgi:Zn-dependent peptidase ImmA (M78 family)
MVNFIEQVRRQAMHTAAREHVSLSTDLTKRIDIFSILRQKKLWVMFQSLDLYGAYLQAKGGHGILLNSKHPPQLQRFTAAHEYGHFVMGHGSRFDTEEQIQPSRPGYDTQEIAAQTFAAHLLMPLQLVNAVLYRMGLPLKPDYMKPQQVYRLSLELGASYLAVVNHLVSLKKVSQEAAQFMRRQSPKAIKAVLGGGVKPQNSWADIWIFTKSDSGRTVVVYIDDELHIYLPEPLTEKHPWTINELANEGALATVKSNTTQWTPPGLDQEDYSGYSHHFLFRAQDPGYTVLQLEKPGTQPEQFELHIQILPRQMQGLDEEQKILLARSLWEKSE